ncbi:hypothetical protein, partial [Prevotella sp.]|uniref:hypothetical protein n=1 Tax=Prevotella sp. TaxID=59823 RepID=UPI00257CC90E
RLLIYKENSTNCYFSIYLFGWETLVINKKQHSAASSPANEASNIKNKKAVTKANDNARRDIQKRSANSFCKVFLFLPTPHSSLHYSNDSLLVIHQEQEYKLVL